MYRLYMNKVLFPVAPSKFQTKINGNNQTIKLINDGEVNVIKTSGLTELSFELLLPTLAKYPFASYQNHVFRDAYYFLEKLEKMKNRKKAFVFLMVRRSPGNETISETRMKVTLEDYYIVEDVQKDGFDMRVSVTLKQWRNYGAEKIVTKKDKTGKTKAVKKKKNRPALQPAKKYTVKQNDTLSKIAKTQLDNMPMWTEIYRMNAETIEQAAKSAGRKSSSNGFFLVPGTVLKLPEL